MRVAFIVCFFLFTLFDLSQVYTEGAYRFVSKPMIMISLIGYFLSQMKSRLLVDRTQLIFLIALCAAFAGDVLLLFEDKFMFGLIAFLIMQVLYSISFLRNYKSRNGVHVFGIILIALCSIIFFQLWPMLEDLRIPVLIYIIAIAFMAYSAFARDQKSSGYWMVFGGTVLFLISDTALALDQFMQDIDVGKITVMTTYAMAQFLIVRGWLSHYKLVQHG